MVKVLLFAMTTAVFVLGGIQLGWMLHSAQGPAVTQASQPMPHATPRVIQVDDGGGGM